MATAKKETKAASAAKNTASKSKETTAKKAVAGKKATAKPVAGKATAKKTVAKGVAAGKKAVSRPSDEMIRAKAYEIYCNRVEQGLPGNNETDWLQAEQALTNK